ncbi:peptidase [Nocardioides lijunqiniae]|uniref:peptidase n=1 Tax=Nocardioides lijunqiniae TaxID=2760832 RepID=UPI0018779740|nr:peptidase [Nocardioides lijunqiniae]
MRRTDPRSRRRVIWAAVASGALLVGALQSVPSFGQREGSLLDDYDASKVAVLESLPHVDPPGTPPHDHHDPATKNAVSRAGEVGTDTQDPTTAAQRRAGAAYAASQRRLPDPRLTKVSLTGRRTALPRTRYAMAGGCYALSSAGRYVTRAGSGLALSRVRATRAAPFYFKATDLGSYLVYGARRDFLSRAGLAGRPSPDADWTVRKTGATFTFTLRGGRSLRADGGRLALGARPTGFRLERVGGCSAYPESGIDVVGRPHGGVTAIQEVRGYVDAHTHGMAFEFLGGEAHCGKPWDRYGAPYALVDCADHRATGGNGSVLETFLSGQPSHDPVGWPTFKDWPAPDSLTHEGTYYRWMERSWRGGQRLFVNLLVENNKLCEIYPLKRNSCDDMDSIRLQARQMHKFEDYIDAQYGGPGKGFYRIVTNPFQARKVINSGRMAVVMGIETSIPFGCTFKRVLGKDVPACSAGEIDRQLDEVHRMGVRQMELVNKFDNALAGVAGDAGTTGVVINSANFLETGSFWDMKHCEPADGETTDRPQLAAPQIDDQQQDALFGAIGQLFGGALPAVPLYGPPAHCNARGLTTLGEKTITGLAKRRMIFDPDHLSVKARTSAVDQIDRMNYPGIVSSHSWSTPDTYPRIYKLGGFITPYAGDSTGFVGKWRRHLGWADKRYYFGFGFGADINGLGAQGDPRGANVANKVRYPFRGLNGVTVKRQTAGKRVYDINKDGVAQYGLYPDWIEDLRKVAGREGGAIVDDMSRGAEAYLQMWERTQGVEADSCRNPGLRKRVSKVKQLVRRGMTTQRVMRAVGQPYQRLGNTYRFCAKTATKRKVVMKVTFTRGGRVQRLR